MSIYSPSQCSVAGLKVFRLRISNTEFVISVLQAADMIKRTKYPKPVRDADGGFYVKLGQGTSIRCPLDYDWRGMLFAAESIILKEV